MPLRPVRKLGLGPSLKTSWTSSQPSRGLPPFTTIPRMERTSLQTQLLVSTSSGCLQPSFDSLKEMLTSRRGFVRARGCAVDLQQGEGQENHTSWQHSYGGLHTEDSDAQNLSFANEGDLNGQPADPTSCQEIAMLRNELQRYKLVSASPDWTSSRLRIAKHGRLCCLH